MQVPPRAPSMLVKALVAGVLCLHMPGYGANDMAVHESSRPAQQCCWRVMLCG